MKVNLSGDLKHTFNNTLVELPKLSEDYLEIFAIDEPGEFVHGAFKFNDKEILFRIEIDEIVVVDIDLSYVKDQFGVTSLSDVYGLPITFVDGKDIVLVDFKTPLAFKKSFKVLARANTEATSREKTAYQVVYLV